MVHGTILSSLINTEFKNFNSFFFCSQFFSHRTVRAALCVQGVLFQNYHDPLTGTADSVPFWPPPNMLPGQMAQAHCGAFPVPSSEYAAC